MKNIIKAIIKVQQTVCNLEKNASVGIGKNSYDGTKMFDVMTAFNKAMSDNGLSILTTDIDDDIRVERWNEQTPYGEKSKQSVFCALKVKYLLLHTSGESVELAGYGHGVDPQDKASGKALTYSLKNTLINTFLTPVGKVEDTDATHSDDIDVPKKKATPKKTKASGEFPPLPLSKYKDVAKFINDGITASGEVTPKLQRWGIVLSKYDVSITAKNKIDSYFDKKKAVAKK